MNHAELQVIFTLRTQEVEHHKGQVSFPGGVVDASDKDIIDTALRETKEEIGIHRSALQVLGVCDDFSTPSGFCITPVVACLPSEPMFTVNPDEVSEVFEVPVAIFLDPSNERTEQRIRDGREVTIYFYRYKNYEIWGATAAMLRSFLHAVVEQVEKPL